MKGSTLNESTLAGLVGVSTRAIRQLGESGVIPHAVRGRYPTTETLRALFKHFRHRRDQRAELVTATVRDRNASAALKELERKAREKELVPMEEAREVVRAYLTPAREAIVSAPAALAARVNPSDPELARLELQDWADNALRKIRDTGDAAE